MAHPAHREDKNLLRAEGERIGMLSPLTLLERSIEKTCVYHSGPGMLWQFLRVPIAPAVALGPGTHVREVGLPPPEHQTDFSICSHNEKQE